jgi:hypothetical protein
VRERGEHRNSMTAIHQAFAQLRHEEAGRIHVRRELDDQNQDMHALLT